MQIHGVYDLLLLHDLLDTGVPWTTVQGATESEKPKCFARGTGTFQSGQILYPDSFTRSGSKNSSF